jgi:hypothetical protein
MDAVQCYEEKVDGKRHPEGDKDIGDVEARIEIWSDAGGERERSVETSTVGMGRRGDIAEEANAEGIDGEQQGKHTERERKTGSPIMYAEEVHRAGRHPVHEGRLVEEADAVYIRSDEVMTAEHLAGDLDVDGIDVVEQAGSEETTDLENEPGKRDDGDGNGIPSARQCRILW